MSVHKLSVVFMGTPDFSVPCLDMLFHHPQIKITQVVSMPDRPAGRGQELKSPEVIEFAKKNSLSYLQTTNINKENLFLENLKQNPPDMIIVLAFAQFLGKTILHSAKIGCFNIHTSLLPRYRGAAPIHYALLNGDKETGVSIQKMVKQMDAGDIVISHKINIYPFETTSLLYTRLKYAAALSLAELIDRALSQKLQYTPQDESLVSFAPTLQKNDGAINFNQSFEMIHNQVRALQPWPGTFCELDNITIKVFEVEKITMLSPNQLTHQCADGYIRLKSIQLPGKKITTDIELLRGYRGDKIITSGIKQ